MRLSLAYEMQRPVVDDHAVIEETLRSSACWPTRWASTPSGSSSTVAGNPESCLRSIAIHEQAGVDELQFLMATESAPHERVISSIKMFGRHVIPELRKKSAPHTA